MDSTEKMYKVLVKDLLKGQVNGLEEKYHEIKFERERFTFENVEEILHEVEKNYKVNLRNLALDFEAKEIR